MVKKNLKRKNMIKMKNNKKMKKLFLRAVSITFIVCVVVISLIAISYRVFIYQKGKETGGMLNFTSAFKEKDINETIAIFGVDQDGYRTDVILVVNYNSQTKKAKVVSIPRDTKVTWSQAQKDKLKEYKGLQVSVTKINEMTSYGGIENIRDFTVDEIQNMLGISIDHYVIVTTDAFRNIVDAVGGVEVDVPVLKGDGLHYDDFAQGLHIHLDPGLQMLNGEQAEGLVRFRKGYAEGDVGRIKTQQLFLDAFAKKMLSPSILTKLPKIVPVIFNSIKTDMALSDIPKYYSHFKKFDRTYLSFEIIPGEAEYQGGKWYFVPNTQEMSQFTQNIFFDQMIAGQEQGIIEEDKSVTIEVLNATTINGIAGKTKDDLEAMGYRVVHIDNYTTNNQPTTLIYAKNMDKAKQFKQYFKQAIIEENQQIDYDIQIILGEDIQ